jgi:putative membrane protein
MAAFLKADLDRISEAIQEAEAKTAGEIYVVVSRTSDDFRLVPVLWAALAAILLPWPLFLLTDLPISIILTAQAVLFVALAAALSHARLRPFLIPPVMIAEASRRKAQSLFMAHGVHLTESRTGVLVYVAVTERRVEILADAAIHDRVGQDPWDQLARDISVAARRGDLPGGIVGAVRRAGSILALHFPRAAKDENELSDRVIEL